MVKKLNSPIEVVTNYTSLQTQPGSPEDYYFFAPEPCLGYFFSESLMRDHMNPQLPMRDEIIDIFKLRSKKYWGIDGKGHRLVSFFTENGLKHFLSTGLITEIPKDFYSPLDPEDMENLVRAAISAMEKGKYMPVVVNEHAFQMPSNLVIATFNERSISLMYMHPMFGPLTFDLSEPSLAFAFYHFLEYLITSDLVLPEEISKMIMQSHS